MIVLRWRSVLSGTRQPLLAKLLAAAVVVQILFYGLVHWVQGISWGPRYLTDMLPVLFWLLAPAIAGLRIAGRAVFAAACVAAIGIEAVGAFGYTGYAHAKYVEEHRQADYALHLKAEKQAAWHLPNTPFLQRPEWIRDLGTPLSGSIDRVTLTRYDTIVVEGWALLGGQTPYDLHLLVDGKERPASTATFVVRPNAGNTSDSKVPSAWKLVFSAKGFAPGKHVFTAMVRSHPNAQPRIFRNFVFDLQPPQANAPTPPIEGSIDAVNLLAGQSADIAGWALVHGESPAEIILHVDGKPMTATTATTTQFFERPDVVLYSGSMAHAGWRITLPITDLAEGEHVLTAHVRTRSGGELQVLRPATLKVPARKPEFRSDVWSLADAGRFRGRRPRL